MYYIKIYDKSYNQLTELYDVKELKIKQVISDISEASFVLYFQEVQIERSYLKKFNKVKIYKQKWKIESVLFDGFIRGFEWNHTSIKINLESNERLLEKRKIRQDFTFSWVQISSILTQIMNHINSIYATSITLNFMWTSIIPSSDLEFKIWDSVFSILWDLANLGFDFYIENNILKFWKNIWIDRTSGIHFLQYSYDVREMWNNSIQHMQFVSDGLDIANGVISIDDGSVDLDTASINEFWLLEDTVSFGWVEYLADNKDDYIEFNFDVISKNFLEAWIGDVVWVYYYSWNNEIANFSWSSKVIEKKLSVWQLESITFKLSQSRRKTKNILDEIFILKNKVQKLEL